MLATTFDAMKAMLRADPSVSPGDRARLLSQLREGPAKPDPVNATASESRLIRRSECARRLAVSLRCVDAWAKKGILESQLQKSTGGLVPPETKIWQKATSCCHTIR